MADPFIPPEWITPKRKEGLMVSSVATGQGDSSFLLPFVGEFPNPRIKAKLNPAWTFNAPFQQIFTSPVGSQLYDIPVLKIKPLGLTWIQPRPSFYTESVLTPFIPTVSNNLRAKPRLIVNIVSRYPLATNTASPFKQNEWPNPLRKPAPRFPHEFWYQIDDNNPIPTSFTQNPVIRKRGPNVGYTYGRQILESSANPFRNIDYPNPIVVKRIAHTTINNLLPQLFPGVGASPFFQTEWPNPLKGKINFHDGWIQETKKYYREEPLQPNQYDWPIFRPINRNQTGHIQFIIPGETNNFVSVTDIPLSKRAIALSWIYNALTKDGITDKPFNQNDWPLPLRRRYPAKDWLDWIYQGKIGLILPDLHGRSICLLADETDYDLEANDEYFDLEARADEFNLGAGGTECE